MPESPHQVVSFPVLCKFWNEDGIWNAAAEDLPVAVFGDTFEAARINLRDALINHLESALELDLIDGVAEQLQRRSQEFMLQMVDIPKDRPLLRMDASIQDDRFVAVS